MYLLKKVKNWKIVLSILAFALLCVASTSCHHKVRFDPVEKEFQKELSNPDNYVILKGNAVGTSYGWDFCLLKIVGINYAEAIEDLWKNSGIPANERGQCSLVNIRSAKGTYWGVIIIGQTYLTVTADIVKLRTISPPAGTTAYHNEAAAKK
jgi:hypothetical protein